MPADLDLAAAVRLGAVLAEVGVALGRAGYAERLVCSWLGAPLVSDARYLIGQERPEWMRRGHGALIALFVAGEEVQRQELRALDDKHLGALIAVGLVEEAGSRVVARAAIVPVRGVLVAADRLDDDEPEAVGSPDLSAWNLAACLPARPRTLLDVGCGAGVATLLAARAGARAVGTDIDPRALAFARVSALLSGIRDGALAAENDVDGRGSARFVEGDLYAGIERRFDHLCFNAPLARAPIAGELPLYLRAPRAASLAAEFLAGADAHLSLEDGDSEATAPEVLCHTQLVPAVEAMLSASPLGRIVTPRFAYAVDGTPHALASLRRGSPSYRISPRVPLGTSLPHLHREVIDRLHATLSRAADREAPLSLATLRPAPWLSLQRTAIHDGHAFQTRELRLGDERLTAEEHALLERCDGRPLGAVAADDGELALARGLALRGLLVE